MRPLRLEMKGFATFRESTVIDFNGLDLFALVGATGAGKSSVIDGIAFALYGSVARYKSANLVAPVINQLSNESRVRLDFTVGADTYTAIRVVRRTATGASTKEARLERGDDVLAGNARELDVAIENLLGLNFDQFTKTVVLPQGDFARFLTETPEARQALLRRLLGMERFREMGTRARERSRDAAAKRDALAEQLDTQDAITEEAIDAAKERVEVLEQLGVTLRAAVLDHNDAQAAHVAAIAAQDANESQHARLCAVEAPADFAKLMSRIAKLTGDKSVASDAARDAIEARGVARAKLDAYEPVADLESRSKLHADAKRLSAELKAASATQAATAKTLSTTATMAQTAAGEVEKATGALESARTLAGIASFAAVLVVGERCPLCHETVSSIPSHDRHDVEDAQRALDAARATAEQASEEHRDAERAHDRAQLERTHTQQHLDEVSEELDGEPDSATTARQLREALRQVTVLERAQTQATAATERLQMIEESLADLDEQSGFARRALTDQRDNLADLGPPVPDETSIAADWDALIAWAKDQSAALATAGQELREQTEAAKARVVNTHKAVVEILADHVEAGRLADVSGDPITWLAEERGRASSELAALRRDHEARAAIQARVAELETEATVATELGRLLSASGFERWLMTDVMQTLAERATDRLRELSNGSYSLVTDGAEFSIRDHRNADEVRSARTLSGGETFLASLALALALSENVADLATAGAPRIESMFLDEGFGTLDPETLDIVAGAIEELGARGQMIGVVTHVRELADRIPVRFDINRTPSGSTAVRVDGPG